VEFDAIHDDEIVRRWTFRKQINVIQVQIAVRIANDAGPGAIVDQIAALLERLLRQVLDAREDSRIHSHADLALAVDQILTDVAGEAVKRAEARNGLAGRGLLMNRGDSPC